MYTPWPTKGRSMSEFSCFNCKNVILWYSYLLVFSRILTDFKVTITKLQVSIAVKVNIAVWYFTAQYASISKLISIFLHCLKYRGNSYMFRPSFWSSSGWKPSHKLQCFDVLLTVHFSIFILVIDQLDAQNQGSGNTYGTLETMTLARHMHYIYATAVMNMVTFTTLWLFSNRSTHRRSCFQMNKCTSSRSTIIMNSSPKKIWTNIILCLTSFIQILHVITHLTPNPQSHAFQPVLS